MNKKEIWLKVRQKYHLQTTGKEFNISEWEARKESIEKKEAPQILEHIKKDIFWLPPETKIADPKTIANYDDDFKKKEDKKTDKKIWSLICIYARESKSNLFVGTWISYQFPVKATSIQIDNNTYIATRIVWIIVPDIDDAPNEFEVTGYYAEDRIFRGTATYENNQFYIQAEDTTSGFWRFLLKKEGGNWQGYQLLSGKSSELNREPAIRFTIWQRKSDDYIDLRNDNDYKTYRFTDVSQLPVDIRNINQKFNSDENYEKICDLESAKRISGKEIDDLNRKKGILDHKISDLENEKTISNHKIIELESAKTISEKEITKLESAKRISDKKIRDLENEKTISEKEISELKNEKTENSHLNKTLTQKKYWTLFGQIAGVIGLISIAANIFQCKQQVTIDKNYAKVKNDFDTIKKDLFLLPYKPTKEEIAKIEGIWECQIGSTLARLSDNSKNLQGKFAKNIADFKYHRLNDSIGYFTIERYGPTKDFKGYAQFISKNLLSIHYDQFVRDVPQHKMRHSLMRMETEPASEKRLVMSVSWEYSTDEIDDILNIREIYKKQCDGHFKFIHRNGESQADYAITTCKDSIVTTSNDSLKYSLDSLLIGHTSFMYRNPRITPQMRQDSFDKHKKRNK